MRNPGRARIVSYAAALLVLAAIVSGFFIMGSPAQVRLYRFDSQKVSDLQTIQYQIVNYYQQKRSAPYGPPTVGRSTQRVNSPKDPQGGVYRYEKTANLSFKLCATFNAETQRTKPSATQSVRIRRRELAAWSKAK